MNKINHLGTYVVRIDNIVKNRAEQYVNYLVNYEHKNHIKRTQILGGQEREIFLHNNKQKIALNELNKIGKGGKPLKVSDKSLTFNIPKDYACSESKLYLIEEQMLTFIKNLYKEQGVNVSTVDFFSNIHNQENKHINMIIPYLDQEGKSIPFIKSNTHFLKVIANKFTEIVDSALNTNIKTYMTQLDQIEAAETFFDNIDQLSLFDISELKIKHKNNKLIKRTLDYIYRIINDEKETKKTIKNLLGSVEKLKDNETLTLDEKEDLKTALSQAGLLQKLDSNAKQKLKTIRP
jgi:preprotein translocase subunit SecD